MRPQPALLGSRTGAGRAQWEWARPALLEGITRGYSANRLEVQDDDLVAAGAGAVVAARGLAAVVRVVLGRPAGEAQAVVLEPVSGVHGRDNRQVGRDELHDRGEVSGLLRH